MTSESMTILRRRAESWSNAACRPYSSPTIAADAFPSFDHLVGAAEQLCWHFESEGLGSLKVDHQLELDRGLDGKLARLRALEDAIDIRSSHLLAIVGSVTMKPVTLPPGCGKLATKPLPIGSPTTTKTMGRLRVCCSSAVVGGVVLETITSGCSATSSFADRCIASVSPGVAQRVSIWVSRPSVQPSF